MISRHNALQGAIYDAAAAAGCAPQEARHLITDSGRRPADILIHAVWRGRRLRWT